LLETASEILCDILRQDKLDNNWYRLSLSAPPLFFKKFIPGMFVMIKTVDNGNDPFLRRPFSIAYVSYEKGFFDVIYRVAGKGTFLLALKKRGEKLNVIGPLGKGFELPGNLKTLCLVAGGIGIAPLISLYQAIKVFKTTKELFFWGVISKNDLTNFNEIYPDLAPFGFKISTEDGSSGKKGNVVDLFVEFREKKTMGNLAIVACGPVKMLSALHRLCVEHETPLYVSIESKMACGQGYCMGCAVPSSETTGGDARKYLRVCQEGPVFEAERIDWSKIEDAIG